MNEKELNGLKLLLNYCNNCIEEKEKQIRLIQSNISELEDVKDLIKNCIHSEVSA